MKQKRTNPHKPQQDRPRRPKTVISFLEEFKSEVAAFFEINHEQAFSLNEIYDHFDAIDAKMQLMVSDLVHELLQEKRVSRSQEGRYQADQSADVLIGRLEHTNKNFGFVIIDGQPDDVWIDSDDLNSAVDGDTVRVTVFSDSRSNRRREGRVEEVMKRGQTEIVGLMDIWPNYGLVSPASKRLYHDIFIPNTALKNAEANDKVLVRITEYATKTRRMEGEVVEVLGKAGQHNTEMHAILAEFGLPLRFPAEVEAEAEAISEKISDDEIARRRDMRAITTFTIDPVDAKDFDDALSVNYLENGNYEIGVHIADVSHYVRPNTALEKEAYFRATSVYLVDRTVPMLPEKLSNNLCSLRPNEDKLTFSAVFELNANARIVREWFGRTVIHSDKRFSYEEAQEVIDNSELIIDNVDSTLEVGEQPTTQDPQPKTQYLKELTLLNDLALRLRTERFENGAINFETVEVKFKLDADGKPLGVYQKERRDSNKLIEEFMLLANKRVAEFVHNQSKTHENTMVYRIHEQPNLDKLRIFSAFAGKLGYKLKVDSEKYVAQSLNQLMSSLAGKPEQNVLEQLAVRTMAKARYSTDDIGHFGLAFRRYSHFTSPIRRYPDVMAHRLLQHYLDKKASPPREEYEAACKNSSEREKLATDAERASIKYKQVEFMASMDSDRVWDGIITGVTEFGIFVEIRETACEGLIRMNDLNDDHYELDKENYRLVGRRTQRFYTFGDAVKVRVKDTDIARRSIDLVLASGGGKSIKNILATKNERNRKSNVVERKQRQAKSSSSSKKRR